MTWFPGRFWHLVAVGQVSWFVLARNVLLVLVFVTMTRRTTESPTAAEKGGN
jgi:hypothetical protein